MAKKSDAKSDSDIEDALDAFDRCAEVEHHNRESALEDLKFAKLDEHWEPQVKAQRKQEGRPCLTFPLLPKFIRQVVNDARQNKPSINVHPADSDADPQTALIYNGLIRNIQVTSRADIAYDTAIDSSVTIGFGYFRINTEYACDDSFDLDLVIQRISNPFSVYGDPDSTEADSSDWNVAFVTEQLSEKAFEKKYKGAKKVDWKAGEYGDLKSPWREAEHVQVAEYFVRDEVPKTILLLSDQTVVDEDLYEERKDEYDAIEVTVEGERVTKGYRVTWKKMSGAETLEERKWLGKYIPIVPVYGEEVNVEGKRHFRGLVRSSKDAQRNYNFWRTATTELVALAPKAPFIGPLGAFETEKAKWESANNRSYAYIGYDGNVSPQRQQFAGIPAGALQEALSAADDMKSIIGMYDASLGARSNETSGVAINARDRQADTSTFHYIDNLARAIAHGGRILLDLIPLIYTEKRIIRVLGPQKAQMATVQLNTPTAPLGPNYQPVQQMDQDGVPITHIYDLARGKYDLTVETGPSFATKREEAAEQMIELIRAYPPAASVLGDLLAKNLDWPDADEVAKRLQSIIPAAQQGDPQQQQMVQGLQQQVQQLTTTLQQMQADNALKSRELDIKAFEASTKRMAEQNKANENRVRMMIGGIPSEQPQGV